MHVCGTAAAVLLGLGVSLNASADQCSGALGITTDAPDAFLVGDLPQTVRVTLSPGAGAGSSPLTLSQVDFAKACFNNIAQVPCRFGNDFVPGGDPDVLEDLPIRFLGLVPDASCDLPNLSATVNGDLGLGTVQFDFDPTTFAAGQFCDITFDIEVFDRGSDASPYFLTGAAQFEGTCLGGAIEGAAAGTTILSLVDPEIEVIKEGPDQIKVGDEACWDITYNDVGNTPVANCTGDDDVLGDLGAFEDGVARQFCATVDDDFLAAFADPETNTVTNTATITCDAMDIADPTRVRIADAVFDFDTHTVEAIDPAIEVTKSGPDSAKAGDEVTYTIGFTNEGVGALENCTGTDDVLGDLGAFEDGVPRTFTYTVSADDPNPLVNVATITCGVVGFDNQASDSDSHSLDWVDPSVELTKQCSPDPVLVGDTIEWSITVVNSGNSALDCVVNDPDAGIVDQAITLDAGETSDPITASRMVILDDFPTISNTASVECAIDGFDNVVEDSDTADCEVEVPAEEICRTPGFWGTHAGTENRRSTNLTQQVIDAAGGELSVCGQTIDNTNVGNVNSAVEAMCVRIQGELQRQLARQLTAMALNCVVSGGGADCTGTSVEDLFADANAACEAGGGGPQLGSWIDQVDCFNNGGQYVDGMCVIDPDDPNNCQNRDLREATDIFDGVSPFPGPAGSPRACSAANGNGIKVVPAN